MAARRATWSMNHNAIHFEDIPSLCDARSCAFEFSISAANTDGASVDLAAFGTADCSTLDLAPVTTAGQSLNAGVFRTARALESMLVLARAGASGQPDGPTSANMMHSMSAAFEAALPPAGRLSVTWLKILSHVAYSSSIHMARRRYVSAHVREDPC